MLHCRSDAEPGSLMNETQTYAKCLQKEAYSLLASAAHQLRVFFYRLYAPFHSVGRCHALMRHDKSFNNSTLSASRRNGCNGAGGGWCGPLPLSIASRHRNRQQACFRISTSCCYCFGHLRMLRNSLDSTLSVDCIPVSSVWTSRAPPHSPSRWPSPIFI